MPKKGKPLRPITSSGASGKQFRRLVTSPRIKSKPAHPLVVIGDLRAGSLSSLDAYLKKHRGIRDREVALELRKLLSGSSARSRFRMVVVDHPDLPADRGGRPKSKTQAPNSEELEIVDEYRAQFDVFGKIEIAREETAKVFSVSVTTVKRAQDKVEAAEAREKRWAELRNRHEAALDKLRRES